MEAIPVPDNPSPAGLVTPRIHVMGLGSIGTFIAHALKSQSDAPPISLLMHRPSLYDEFKSQDYKISVVNIESKEKEEQAGYDVDLLETNSTSTTPFWKFIPAATASSSSSSSSSDAGNSKEFLDSGEGLIHNLIITVKGPATKSALNSIKHRVDSRSTICLIQNGMGQVTELNNEVFTDPKSRPTYLLGIISYGVYLSSNFAAVHAGYGTTSLGIVREISQNADKESSEDEFAKVSASSQYMLRRLAQPTVFSTSAYRYPELLQLQLEKLCMNAVMNPLTAILNFHNGYLLHNEPLLGVHRQLLAELSSVIRQMPEFKQVPGVTERFSPERLEKLLIDVSEKTAANSSSMREDVRKEKDTEVDYINGYVVNRGEELGIDCVHHRMLLNLVKAKTQSQRAAQDKQ